MMRVTPSLILLLVNIVLFSLLLSSPISAQTKTSSNKNSTTSKNEGGQQLGFPRCLHNLGIDGRWVRDWDFARRQQYPKPEAFPQGPYLRRVMRNFKPTNQTPFPDYQSWIWQDDRCPVNYALFPSNVCSILDRLQINRIVWFGDSISKQQYTAFVNSMAPTLIQKRPIQLKGIDIEVDLNCSSTAHNYNTISTIFKSVSSGRAFFHSPHTPIRNLATFWNETTDLLAEDIPGRKMVIWALGPHYHALDLFQTDIDFARSYWEKQWNRRPQDIYWWRPTIPGHYDCNRHIFSKPLSNYSEFDDSVGDKYHWFLAEPFNTEASSKLGDIMWKLPIYNMTLLRRDGHADCLHYRDPGPIDQWNHVLFTLLDQIEGGNDDSFLRSKAEAVSKDDPSETSLPKLGPAEDLPVYCTEEGSLHNTTIRQALQFSPKYSAAWNKTRDLVEYVKSRQGQFHIEPGAGPLYAPVEQNLKTMFQQLGLTEYAEGGTEPYEDKKTLVLEYSSTMLGRPCTDSMACTKEQPRIIIQVQHIAGVPSDALPFLVDLNICHAAPYCVVWDFSDANIRHQSYSDSSVIMPFMIQQRLSFNVDMSNIRPKSVRSIDVCFFGKLTQRRKRIQQELSKDGGLAIKYESTKWMGPLVSTFPDCKVCPIVHANGAVAPGEMHRLSEMAVYGCHPVVETWADTGEEAYSKCGGVLQVDYSNLTSMVRDTLTNNGGDLSDRISKWWLAGVDWTKLFQTIFEL